MYVCIKIYYYYFILFTFQGLIKYIGLFWYSPEILDLIRKTRRFYNIEEFKETYSFAKFLFSACKRFQKLFITIGIVSVHIYFFKPITGGDRLIFPSRMVIDSLVLETVILFSQYYCLLILAAIVPGYDLLYISYSVHVIIQLRILKHKFEHTTKYVSTRKIYEYIRCHQLLLS